MTAGAAAGVAAGAAAGPGRDWRPGASLATLRRAAHLRRRVREHFDATGALEVVTPVLSRAAGPEPSIEPFDTRSTAMDGRYWLQTSPEFAMKRLVAAYGQDVWQLAPVFRRAERGHRHNAEFLLLEWYRVGQDLAALMQDVAELLVRVAGEFPPFDRPPQTRRYGVCVREAAGDWPERLSVADIRDRFENAGRHFPDGVADHEHDAALDLLVDTFVLPELPTDRPTFIVGYPTSQASLARCTLDVDGREVAARFELYAGTVELANGFHELIDAGEQRRRFTEQLAARQADGQPLPDQDEAFLAALEAGLPDCSGVALGLDRLTMLACGLDSLDRVMTFADERC